MANLATVYQKKVSERIVQASVVGGLTNKNYKFVGGGEIVIYSVNNMPLQNYERDSGAQRFGNAANIQTTDQTFSLGEDVSFNGVVDTLDDAQQMGVLKPGAILARQTREVIIPFIDSYVLETMYTAMDVAGNDVIISPGATTTTNAYANFLTLRAYSINAGGPEEGYRAVMTATYYNDVKQSGFVTTGDAAQKIRQSGFLGDIDGTPVKIASSGRLPSNVDLMIVHPMATTFAQQLKKYEVLNKIWGIDGQGIQGRHAFDAFVDVNKVLTLTCHRTA